MPPVSNTKKNFKPTTLPSEAEYQRTIIHAAKLAGWLVHAERPAMFQSGRWATPIQGDAGFPDLVLVHERRQQVAFIELKRGRNKTSAGQDVWLSALGSVMPSALVKVWVMPNDLDEALLFLTGLSVE